MRGLTLYTLSGQTSFKVKEWSLLLFRHDTSGPIWLKKKKRGPVFFNSILSCFTRNSSLVLKETRNAPLSECDCLIPSNSNHMTPIMPYLTDDIWFFLLNYFYNKYYIPKKWFPYIASSHYVCPFSTHNTDFLAYLLQQLYWVWEAFFSWFLNTRHKAMAPYSSALAWKTPWTEEPGGLQSMGSIRVGNDWATSLPFSLSCIGEGNGNPLQCSCRENPRDGGAWWLPSMGSHRVGHDWSDLAAVAVYTYNIFHMLNHSDNPALVIIFIVNIPLQI